MRVQRRIPFSMWLAIGLCCPLVGCGELARSGFKGAVEQVGTEMVESASDEHLKKMFQQANEMCPTRMDAYTTLEEIVMVRDDRVEFRYKVSDTGRKIAAQYDKRAMKQAAIEHMKGKPMAIAIAERDLSIEHIYNDASGNCILSYIINREVLEGNLDPIGSPQSNPFETQVVSADESEIVVEADEIEPPSDPVIEIEPAIDSPPPLPQAFNEPLRTKDNPAGVQTNPFFNQP